MFRLGIKLDQIFQFNLSDGNIAHTGFCIKNKVPVYNTDKCLGYTYAALGNFNTEARQGLSVHNKRRGKTGEIYICLKVSCSVSRVQKVVSDVT